MKRINLSESETQTMRQFYQNALVRTMERLKHIQKILQKLETNSNKNKTGYPKVSDSKVNISKSKLKRGRKSKWEPRVIETLNAEMKPVTYHRLTEAIIKSHDLPASKKDVVKQTLVNLIFRQRQQNGIITTIPSGSREKFIVLKSWLDSNGQLKQAYQMDMQKEVEELKTTKPSKKIKKKHTKKDTKKQPIWESYVIELLRTEGKPITVEIMTQRAMKRFNILPKLYQKTLQAVSRSMNELEKKDNLVKPIIQKDSGIKAYGLREWEESQEE